MLTFDSKNRFAQQTWIYLVSISALMILALFSVGWLHPDEHFQILEFARWKLEPSNSAPLPWEFHYRMRPAVQPALVVALSELMSLADIRDPFMVAMILRFLSGILSFAALWRIYRLYATEIPDPLLRRQFTLMSFLLWFTLYLAVRFCSETWSGAIFVIAFTTPFMSRTHGNLRYLVTGLLLGCAFIIRYQTGFMIVGFLAWLLFIRKEKLIPLFLMVTGFLAAVVIGVLIDRWFYGEWVLTAWNYFQQNILADKISGFGIEPWYFYFTELTNEMIPPFSIVIILAFLIVFILRRKDLLTWTLLPFILVHIVIGHKETRFLFPLAWFVPVMMLKGTEIISSFFGNNWIRTRFSKIIMTVFWVTNFILLFILFFIPADRQVNLYHYLYQSEEPSTLYYLDENPYQRALQVEFYRKPGLTFTEVSNIEVLDTVQGTCFLALKTSKPDLSKFQKKKVRRVYSTLPESVKYINFNHWLDRTRVWYIFRLD